MIQMEIQVCMIDELPVEQSRAYDVLVREMGIEIANRWTYWIVIPPDSE